MIEIRSLLIHCSTNSIKSFLKFYILSPLYFRIESTVFAMFFGWFFYLNMYSIIYCNFKFISDFTCFNVWMFGNVLFYLCTDIWSLMHSEHNSSIQSKQRCLINYWGWILQWFDTIWVLGVGGSEAWVIWIFCKLWLWTIGIEIKLLFGRKARDERLREWANELVACTLVYFLLRKFIESICYLNLLRYQIY